MDGRLLYKHSLAVRKPKNVKCMYYRAGIALLSIQN